MTWLAAFFCIAFVVAAVAALFFAHLNVVERVIFIVAACAMPLVTREVMGDIRQPKPGLRLDSRGVEGAFGRIRWEHVRRISISVRFESPGWFKPYVILHLSRAVQLARAPGPWVSDWLYRSGVHGTEIRLQLWGRKSTVRRDLARFYEGPIE